MDKILVIEPDVLSRRLIVCVFVTVIISRSSFAERFRLVVLVLGGILHEPYKVLFMFQGLYHIGYMMLATSDEIEYKIDSLYWKFFNKTFLSLYSSVYSLGVRAISHEIVTINSR